MRLPRREPTRESHTPTTAAAAGNSGSAYSSRLPDGIESRSNPASTVRARKRARPASTPPATIAGIASVHGRKAAGNALR